MTEAERKAYRNNYGKRINQTIITGGGKGVLTHKYKIPADEVDTIWDDYFKAMPEIRQLQKEASAVMRNRRYVISLLGRRARYRDKDYVAVNRLLQCGNADIIKLKMVEVDEYLASEGRPLDMLNNCHDALDFQFNEEHRHVYEECLAILTRFGPGEALDLKVPIEIDRGEGPNWEIATYGEPK